VGFKWKGDKKLNQPLPAVLFREEQAIMSLSDDDKDSGLELPDEYLISEGEIETFSSINDYNDISRNIFCERFKDDVSEAPSSPLYLHKLYDSDPQIEELDNKNFDMNSLLVASNDYNNNNKIDDNTNTVRNLDEDGVINNNFYAKDNSDHTYGVVKTTSPINIMHKAEAVNRFNNDNNDHFQNDQEEQNYLNSSIASTIEKHEFLNPEQKNSNSLNLVSNLFLSNGSDNCCFQSLSLQKNEFKKEENRPLYDNSLPQSNYELKNIPDESVVYEKLFYYNGDENQNISAINDQIENENFGKSEKDLDEELLADSIQSILSSSKDGDDGSEVSESAFYEINALKEVEGLNEGQIVSAVGTVRGIKNRVKARLLDYLSNIDKKEEEEEKPKTNYFNFDNEKEVNAESDYIFESSDKVTIYTTSLGLIRKTKSDCLYVRKAFRNLMYKTEERDITDQLYRREYIKYFSGLLPPQVVINGKHIGGRKEIERLIETSQIHDVCVDVAKIRYDKEPCKTCIGHGYVNCPRCLGSGRAKVLRYGGTRNLNYLKCTYCKNGLLRCLQCINSIG